MSDKKNLGHNRKKDFLNKEGFLGSAYDADSEGEEGKYYVYSYDEIKDLENIERFFEIKPEGNWEKKIILIEKEKPSAAILKKLLQIRSKRTNPFFEVKEKRTTEAMWVFPFRSAF